MKAGSLGTAVTVGLLLWIGAHGFAIAYGMRIAWSTSAAAGVTSVVADLAAGGLLIVPFGLLRRRRLAFVAASVAAVVAVAALGQLETGDPLPPGIQIAWSEVGIAPWLVAIAVWAAERYWQRDPEWDPDASQDAHPGFKGESYSQVKK